MATYRSGLYREEAERIAQNPEETGFMYTEHGNYYVSSEPIANVPCIKLPINPEQVKIELDKL